MPARGFALTVRSCVPSRAMRATTEGSYPSGQRGQTVNLLASAFVGSNPTLPTFAQLAGRLTFRTVVPWRERRVGLFRRRWFRKQGQATCGCSSMVELLPSKQVTRVRFPSPAPGSVARGSARHVGRLGKCDGSAGARRMGRLEWRSIRRHGKSPVKLAAVAQSVEHLLGKEEVLGSSPSSSSS